MSLSNLVKQTSAALVQCDFMLVTAESCTGGLIAKVMTDQAGSSSVFERGFVTYTNDAKIDLLHVSPDTLQEYGAVSFETAKEMAIGALQNSKAHIAVSVTGIAGPGGGTEEKPVGLVYIGIATKERAASIECHFHGTRTEIRDKTAHRALELVLEYLP